MKIGHHRGSWSPTTTTTLTVAVSVVLFQSVILLPFLRATSALSINKRESATEQVLIITTVPTESPLLLNDEEGGVGATTPGGGGVMLDSEQSDQASVGFGGGGLGDASTTVDTIIIQDTTGESWEVDPTASSIISKDVEIEIATSENTNKLSVPQGDSAAAGGGGATQVVDSSKPVLPEIYSFHVESNIQYRYSRTYVTSRVANKDLTRAQEVTFSVVLPETAFISKFIMEIDGKAYEAYVKEKEEAKKDYVQAQSQGQSAGLVEKSTRNSNVFNVNVNVKPQTKVTFNLTYEELLTRRLGRYEQAININPDQVSSIQDYKIIVNIVESRNLSFLRVPSLSNDIDAQNPEGNNPDAVIERPAANKAKISWSPNAADQKKLVKDGISGKFLVQYDVDREADAGQILVMQGYFVHFFAPENLTPLRKHVVFILDISGSMWGRKMEQLKESQQKILDDLSTDDYFNIITFSSDVYLWSPNDSLDNKRNEFRQPSFPAMSEITPPELLARRQPLPATRENVNKAKAFIDSLVASGGTNIHDAIIEALNLTAAIKNAQQKAVGGESSSTEPVAVETTILPITSASTTTTTTSASTSSGAPSTTSASTTSSTSTTTEAGTDEDDENRTVMIIDIAKSDLGDLMTEKPEEATTTVSESTSDPGKVILPANVQSLIIFLTDGEPTVGITDPPEIQKLIQSANRNLSIPIFSLGFGEGADFPFLKKLSLQNNGFGRKIYEASDAALQLKGFYNEIASPLLSNVKFNYTSENYNITDLTVTRFPTVFGGTEIAVAGKLVAPPKPERDDNAQEDDDITTIAPSHDATQETTIASLNDDYADDDETPGLSDIAPPPNRLSISCDFEQTDRYYFDVNVEGIGRDGELDLSHVEVYERPESRECGGVIDFPIIFFPGPPGSPFPPRPTPPPTQEDIFLERLWAYLTIQQLLEKDLAGADDSSSAGDANPADNSIDLDNGITPSSTVPPHDSSQVTRVLPNQGTTPSPSVKRNTTSGKPETPKERALRLALKYGFVTPLTSLVVVKPNSSDVTNAVPTDGRPDALDSLYALRSISFNAPILRGYSPRSSAHVQPARHMRARYGGASRGTAIKTTSTHPQAKLASLPMRYPSGPSSRGSGKKSGVNAPQSMSVLALAAPAYQSGIRNKIAYSPLPVPISSHYQSFSRPIPLVGGGGAGFPAPGFANYNFVAQDYDASNSAEEQLISTPVRPADHFASTTYTPPLSTSVGTTTTTTTVAPSLTLRDITWLTPNTVSISVNETDYMIARNQTSDDNEGYECTNSMNGTPGQCRHLQSCVLPAFRDNEALYMSSYFCGIKSQSSTNSYAGVCCASSRAKSDEEP